MILTPFRARLLLGALTVVVFFVFQNYCGYHGVLSRSSPSKRSRIELFEDLTFHHIMINLIHDKGTMTVYESRSEMLVNFFEVYWTPDESAVAVFMTGSSPEGLAFSVTDGREIPFEQLQKQFGESLVRKYHLPEGTDGMKWAVSHEGVADMQY